MRRTFFAAALIAALMGVAACGGDDDNSTSEQKRLPDVTLPSLTDGEPVALRSLRGPAVVNVWASWCKPCKRELPLYAAFAKAHPSLKVLGIDFQDGKPDTARAMLETAGVEYPVVTDFDGEVRAFVLPKLVLLGEDGSVVYDEYVEIKSLQQLEDIVAEHLGVIP